MPERLDYRFYYSCTAEIFGSYVLLAYKTEKNPETETKPKQGRLLETYLWLKQADLYTI